MTTKPSQYAKVLYDMAKGKEKEEILSALSLFVAFLKKKNDLYLLKKIVSDFNDVFNKNEGITEVVIGTKSALSDTEPVLSFIRKEFGVRNIEPHFTVSSALKGGIVIRTKDALFDASVAASITKLKKRLI